MASQRIRAEHAPLLTKTPILAAVRSLLDTTCQRIEVAMPYETECRATEDQSIVFVIEREQVIRSALHYILQDRYRTYTFASLDDALASAMDPPDTVLVGASILQGQNDGLITSLCIRYGGAAVLVVADRSSDPLAQLALERGARGIVCKPISFDTVCEAVEQALTSPIFRGAPSRLIRVAFG
jgi:FixJ family two-component response regulator